MQHFQASPGTSSFVPQNDADGGFSCGFVEARGTWPRVSLEAFGEMLLGGNVNGFYSALLSEGSNLIAGRALHFPSTRLSIAESAEGGELSSLSYIDLPASAIPPLGRPR